MKEGPARAGAAGRQVRGFPLSQDNGKSCEPNVMDRRGRWSGLDSDRAQSFHEHSESPARSYSPLPNRTPMRRSAGCCCSRTPASQPPGPSPADTTSMESMTRNP